MRKKLGKFQKSEVEFFLIGRSVLLCAICQIISVILIFCENIVYEENLAVPQIDWTFGHIIVVYSSRK